MINSLPAFIAKYDRLHVMRNIDSFRYKYQKQALIYGIYCEADDMMYIGSTWDSVRRFRQHLITGHTSNIALQNAIKVHGLKSITVYVFELVKFDPSTNRTDRKSILVDIEQRYVSSISKDKLYNSINSANIK